MVRKIDVIRMDVKIFSDCLQQYLRVFYRKQGGHIFHGHNGHSAQLTLLFSNSKIPLLVNFHFEYSSL